MKHFLPTHHQNSSSYTGSAWQIIRKNVFTLFNLVNLALAAMILFVGSYKNLLFLGVAICNTLIGIINELRAKQIVDKLRLLSEKNPVILKDGHPTEVTPREVMRGDLLVLKLGDQIPFDCIIKQGSIEVNESFVTGEQDNIAKHPGDRLVSGSFVVSGSATADVVHTATDSFISELQSEASHIKTADSQLFTFMHNIIKHISYSLVPVGALLLWSRLRTEPNSTIAVTSTAAALINMIPEGLIILTSGVLALATIRLSRKKVLVQDLYATETLARVDTVCLDKTGTLTTGEFVVHDFLLPDGTPIDPEHPTPEIEKSFLRPLAAILTSDSSNNATIKALKKTLLRKAKFKAADDFAEIIETIPFSSDRKYSGIKTRHHTYLLGAAEFLIKDPSLVDKIEEMSGDYRTLVIVRLANVLREPAEPLHRAFRSTAVRGLAPSARGDGTDGRGPMKTGSEALWEGVQSSNAEFLGLIRLSDTLRPTAKTIINYFYANHINIKIISGDALSSVLTTTRQAGIRGTTGIDLSTIKTKNYAKLVKNYAIFARVTPAEKKELIKAIKKQGHTVAMTGDGVNDILAMKEADVSLAIGEGADAARRVAKFVLLNSNYDAIPDIIDEGRRSINNLERSTSLFLAKTVYASILAVLFVLIPLSYPYAPVEMSLLNFLCIGLPGTVLALEKNTSRPKDRFRYNLTHYSIPIGIIISIAMVILSLGAEIFQISRSDLVTLSFVTTFVIDLVLIYLISRPLNNLRLALIVLIIALAVVNLLFPITRTFFLF